MKKKQKLIVVVLIAAVTIGIIFVFMYKQYKNNSSDTNPLHRCSQQDWDKNNCVPAGRCTPPGDPREATIDCDIKNYDHKFNTEL